MQKAKEAESNGPLPKKPPRQVAPPPHTYAPRHHDDDRAFLVDARHVKDDLAERLGEEAVSAMTRGGSSSSESFDRVYSSEVGGPFVQTSAADEFADDFDETNPPDAEREPLPKT